MVITKDHIENAEKLFSRETGYNSKSILNKAPDKVIPSEFFDKCSKGITLEYLDSLISKGIPVLKYKTQITLHGKFIEPEGFKFRTYYKSMIINKNQSLGVRYSAVDRVKKEAIRDRLRVTRNGYSMQLTSTEDSIMRGFIDKQAMTAEYNRIASLLEGVICDCSAFWSVMFGCGWININLCAIPENLIDKLIFDLTGITPEGEKELEEQHRIYWDNWKKENDLKSQQRDKEDNEARLLWESKIGLPLFDFNKWDGQPTVLVAYDRYEPSNTGKFVIHKKYGQTVFRPFNIWKDKPEISFRAKGVSSITKNKNFFVMEVIEDSTKTKSEKPAKTKSAPKTDSQKPSDIRVLDYSERAVIVIGNTLPIKDKLKDMGGWYNKFLTCPETGKKIPGWVFPKSKKDILIF